MPILNYVLSNVSVASVMDSVLFPLKYSIYLREIVLERFSNECRKTKTTVIIPANHNKHKLSNEPIRTRSKYMSLAPSAGKRVRESRNWFEFYF